MSKIKTTVEILKLFWSQSKEDFTAMDHKILKIFVFTTLILLYIYAFGWAKEVLHLPKWLF